MGGGRGGALKLKPVYVCAHQSHKDVRRQKTGAGVCSGKQLCNFNCEVKDNTVIFFSLSLSSPLPTLKNLDLRRGCSRPRNLPEPPREDYVWIYKSFWMPSEPSTWCVGRTGFSLMGPPPHPPIPHPLTRFRQRTGMEKEHEYGSCVSAGKTHVYVYRHGLCLHSASQQASRQQTGSIGVGGCRGRRWSGSAVGGDVHFILL